MEAKPATFTSRHTIQICQLGAKDIQIPPSGVPAGAKEGIRGNTRFRTLNAWKQATADSDKALTP